jgi:uncharacterized membrane protein YphA (DoxX/SURF4 family)
MKREVTSNSHKAYNLRLTAQIIKYFVGILFIISGLIKLNDPTGTAIKFEEYFEVFSADFTPLFHYLIPYSMIFSVVMSTLEVVLGVALIIQNRYRTVLYILLGVIIFFSFLTFYSAYFNKVTDCGCFGDAIKLTPWQSFSKDILLLVLIIILLIGPKVKTYFNQGISDVIVSLSAIGSIFLAIYALNHLPPIDFLAYKKGAHIPTLMKPSAPFKFKYVMEKNGEVKEFFEYPDDTTYTFKEMVLLNPEAQPKITDYNVRNAEGDATEETFTGKKLMIVIVDAAKSDIEGIDRVKELVKEIEKTDIKPMVLTGSDELTFENFRHEVQLAVPYYFVDGVVLKAMIRSNPGLIYMEEGTVKGKWHHNDVPSLEEVKGL